MPGVHVVLLRGINVGRAKRIAMAELREALTDAGFGGVRTLGQSGNVILHSADDAARVVERVRALIADRFAMQVRVIVRSAAELREIAAGSPLAAVADEPKNHLVAFLAQPVAKDLADQIEAEDHGAERVAFRGREMYLWCPGGQQDSALVRATGEKRLGVAATVRNFNTVGRLAEMAAEPER